MPPAPAGPRRYPPSVPSNARRRAACVGVQVLHKQPEGGRQRDRQGVACLEAPRRGGRVRHGAAGLGHFGGLTGCSATASAETAAAHAGAGARPMRARGPCMHAPEPARTSAFRRMPAAGTATVAVGRCRVAPLPCCRCCAAITPAAASRCSSPSATASLLARRRWSPMPAGCWQASAAALVGGSKRARRARPPGGARVTLHGGTALQSPTSSRYVQFESQHRPTRYLHHSPIGENPDRPR